MRLVSVIIPVIRPEKAAMLENILAAGGIDSREFGDKYQKYYNSDIGVEFEIIAIEDTDRIGCPKMVKKLTAEATGDVICFLGDDTTPLVGWLQAGLDKMATLPDGWGVVGLKTEGSVSCAHWLADRRMLELTGGAFFSTEYRHFFCDNELMDIAVENERWAITDEVVISHDHPVNGHGDDLHISPNDPRFSADQKTYFRRKRVRVGGLAIGFPLVDPNVPVQFFTSFVCMEKPSFTLLFPQFPHGPWTGSIADARNSLVQQARNEGAAHLLMLDTDQIYPPETLKKLMSHQVDICGVRVHRRYPPFDPIFLRGNIGQYLNVSIEEAYSGDLIEIDATGTGCLLIDMAIFDDLEYPWFEFGTAPDGRPVGEDISFCHKAKLAGKRIFVDTSIKVGHLATIEIDEKMHRWCELVKQKKQENGNG